MAGWRIVGFVAVFAAAMTASAHADPLADCIRLAERTCLVQSAVSTAQATNDPLTRVRRLVDLAVRLADIGERDRVGDLVAAAARAVEVTDAASRDEARLQLAVGLLAARDFDGALAQAASAAAFAELALGLIVAEAAANDRAFAEAALPRLASGEQSHVRSVLAQAYAADGDAVRAKAFAAAIPSPARGELVAQIVKLIADKGRTHDAMTLAWDVADGVEVHFAMAAAVTSMAERDIFADGHALADLIINRPAQDVAFAALARAHARAGDFDAALETASRIDVVRRARTMTAIAVARATRGDVAGALQAARAMNENERALALADIAEGLLAAGDTAGAKVVLAELGDTVGLVPRAVVAWARAGDAPRAIALSERIGDPTTRASVLLDAAEAARPVARPVLEEAERVPLAPLSASTRRAAIAWARLGEGDIAADRLSKLSEDGRYLALLTLIGG